MQSCKNSTEYQPCDKLIQRFENKLKEGSLSKDTVLLSSFEKIANGHNDCREMDLMLADYYFDIKDYPNSKYHYRRFLITNKESTYALFNLSMVFYNTTQYDSAIELLNTAALQKTSGYFVVDYNDNIYPNQDVSINKISYFLALNYYYKGNYQMAMFNFNYCIKNKFSLKECYLYRGAIYYENKECQKAYTNFNLAKEFGNPDADFYLQKKCK